MTHFWWPAYSLVGREIIRFVRQRSRLVGALLQPLLIWIMVGVGAGGSFKPASGQAYSDYFFPGVLLMIVLFTAIFSTISIIEDRREGFLQGVQVAPIPASALVLGKCLGGALLGTLQAVLLLPLLLLPNVHLSLTPVGAVVLIPLLLLLGLALTAVGVLIAWQMNSTQGYHAIMSVVLLPLWFLSGALFSADGAPGWMRLVMWLNPLGHGLTLVRWCFVQPPGVIAAEGGTHLWASATYVLLFGIVAFILATVWVRKKN